MAIESRVTTLELIAKKTTGVPAPIVYRYDTTSDNEIGAPYICMSFTHGKRLSEMWYQQPIPADREELRLKSLARLARLMDQLAHLSFPKIGSLMKDDVGDVVVGPAFDYASGAPSRVIAKGPYDSLAEF